MQNIYFKAFVSNLETKEKQKKNKRKAKERQKKDFFCLSFVLSKRIVFRYEAPT